MSRLITILRASQIIIVRAPGRTLRGRPPAYPPTAQRRQRQPGSSRSVASSDDEVQDHGQHDRRDDREHKHPKAPQSATQRLHVVSADSHVRPLPDCGRREPAARFNHRRTGDNRPTQQGEPNGPRPRPRRDQDLSSDRPGDDRRIDDPNSENRDDHPVGTTTGTGAGATAGAIAGAAVGGPAGVVVGGVVGGVAGGLAGHEAAEKANPEGDEVSGDKLADPGTKRD